MPRDDTQTLTERWAGIARELGVEQPAAATEKPYHSIGRVWFQTSKPFATEDEAIEHATNRLRRTGEIHDVVRREGKTLTIVWRPDEV